MYVNIIKTSYKDKDNFYYILIGVFCLFYGIYNKVMFITNLLSLRKFEDTKVAIKTRKSQKGILYKNTKGQTMIYRTLQKTRLKNTNINRGEFMCSVKASSACFTFWYHLITYSLAWPRHFLLKCLCHDSGIRGHVFVCKEYRFCLFLRFWYLILEFCRR